MRKGTVSRRNENLAFDHKSIAAIGLRVFIQSSLKFCATPTPTSGVGVVRNHPFFPTVYSAAVLWWKLTYASNVGFN